MFFLALYYPSLSTLAIKIPLIFTFIVNGIHHCYWCIIKRYGRWKIFYGKLPRARRSFNKSRSWDQGLLRKLNDERSESALYNAGNAFRGEHNGLTISSVARKGEYSDTRGTNLMLGKSPMPQRDKRSCNKKEREERECKRAAYYTSLRERRARIINIFPFFFLRPHKTVSMRCTEYESDTDARGLRDSNVLRFLANISVNLRKRTLTKRHGYSSEPFATVLTRKLIHSRNNPEIFPRYIQVPRFSRGCAVAAVILHLRKQKDLKISSRLERISYFPRDT